MELTFLEASEPLTKTYAMSKGQVVKTPYPFVWEFTSHAESASDLPSFERLLVSHASKGHCLLKGQVGRPLVKESRAGSTNSSQASNWVCLDFDGSITLGIQATLNALGLGNVSYVVQYSASADLFDATLRAHVFMQLDEPKAAPLLKQWLVHLNHQTPELRSAMKLTKTGNAISWPLDISACQNDKLIYITPPILKGIQDPFITKKTKRIKYVKREKDTLSIPATFSTEKNRDLTLKRIAELRDQDGLPKRKFTTKMHGSIEILAKPDVCTITEMKQERGFTYFNLNGGDSWAYYHPDNNPEFIHSFKGETSYLTKELLPEYWAQLTSAPIRTSAEGLTYLAFCDRKTSAYWRGTYDANTDMLDINQAKNETQLRHFAKQHGMPLGDFIPEWDLTFEPQSDVRIDFDAHVINTFSPSPYMRGVGTKSPGKIPPTIHKVIDHALGNDPKILEHFINWLAFIFQYRDRTTTAWVCHGVEGTGKGVLAHRIIKPIFGAPHVAVRRMEEFNEQYNHFMKSALIVVVDEVQTKALDNEKGVMAKMRGFITEPTVPIRVMHANAVESPNYTNWMFNSNMPDPVAIPKNDRRHNVAKYQSQKLQISDKELDLIEQELQPFATYLHHYKVVEQQARTIMDTQDRSTMISISESSIDQVAGKLLEGDFEFFMDQLPSGTKSQDTASSQGIKLSDYKMALVALIDRTDPKGKCNIGRDEMRTVFEFVIGNMPATPNKFTSLLKHHRIHTTKVWLPDGQGSGISVYGLNLKWIDTSKFKKYRDRLLPKAATPSTTGKVVVMKRA